MPGVCLTAEATQRSVGVVGAVASGAGEYLELELETATRLNAIAVEAASNVVAHAYPGSSGPFELEISAPERCEQDLTIAIRDCGGGLMPAVASSEPGLGLPMICALADEVEISSSRENGTAIEARLQPSPEGEPDAPGIGTDPRSGGSLCFTGHAFIEAVLPRTLAALVAGSTTALDVLTSVLRVGDAIAYGLRSAIADDGKASVCWDSESPREIRIGPLPGDGAERLLTTVAMIEPPGEGSLELRAVPDEDGDYALVGLPNA